jgi:glycine/D-amino acid oxidase-like deaminating enzyme
MQDQHRVAIVGAGIVGLSCALWLQKKGFTVTLIDPEPPGSGTSSGNACTIADYGCIPVNNPDIFKRLPSLLFSKNSPLTVNHFYALTHLPWLLQFLSNCRPSRVSKITENLGQILQQSYQGLNPLVELSESQGLMSQQGCMHVYSTLADFESARATNEIRRQQGSEYIELDRAAIQQLEPYLRPIFEKGILFEKASQTLNPQSLCTNYFNSFLKNEGQYLNQRVLEAIPDGEIVKLKLDGLDNQLTVDHVVIAAGAFSKKIKGTGANHLPLETERGYHIQYANLQSSVNRPVAWNQAGIYATPMNEGLRFAGTVEIAGNNPKKNQQILDYIARKGGEMFDLPNQPDQQWLGFRPTLPDALPVIGHSSVSNHILFAFGHHHLGLTLAGITGKLISELLNNEPLSLDITAFSPDRFH